MDMATRINSEADTETDTAAGTWLDVCSSDDILANTGVCARLAGRHVAIFKLAEDQFHAIDNVDPRSGASVLSRGLVGNLGAHTVVASPLYKNHFDLHTGACLETPEHSVTVHAVRVENSRVLVQLT